MSRATGGFAAAAACLFLLFTASSRAAEKERDISKSKYLSPGMEILRSYKFDSSGNPIAEDAAKKKKEDKKAKKPKKKRKWTRKPGKRRAGVKAAPKPAESEDEGEGGESGAEAPAAGGGEEAPSGDGGSQGFDYGDAKTDEEAKPEVPDSSADDGGADVKFGGIPPQGE